MKTVNIYDAKTNLSKLLEQVQAGNDVVIAKAGKPIADLVPHKAKKTICYGKLASKIKYKDADFVGIDKDIQKMFYE